MNEMTESEFKQLVDDHYDLECGGKPESFEATYKDSNTYKELIAKEYASLKKYGKLSNAKECNWAIQTLAYNLYMLAE